MKCEEKCGGSVDPNKSTLLEITPLSQPGEFRNAYACNICGRLHWSTGLGVLILSPFYCKRLFLKGIERKKLPEQATSWAIEPED